MSFSGILIANRGEIAIRIARAASDLGIRSVAVFSSDDESSLHVIKSDERVLLPGKGAAAYLDMDSIISAAKKNNCDAIHPGYGFLSEQADFAKKCELEGVTFIGPKEKHLRLFGDKGAARDAARSVSVPVLNGINQPITLEEAESFFEDVKGNILVKAIAGGGGRGTRLVTRKSELREAFARCQAEASVAFGCKDLYVEEYLHQARHIEIQIVGDGSGNIVELGERECSVQRRNQKVIEIAPCPNLSQSLRQDIVASAIRLAKAQGYLSLGTFEFLVELNSTDPKFFFIEANARLQVEHTVTEEIMGLDLVRSQIQIAQGLTLKDLRLDNINSNNRVGFAIQARVNMEKIRSDGTVLPSSGVLSAYEPPSGPGVRVDGFGYAGYRTNTLFDSLLAKVIVRDNSPHLENAIRKMVRALSEFRLEGVQSNLSFLKNILSHTDFVNCSITTRWVDEHKEELGMPWLGRNLCPELPEQRLGNDAAVAKVDSNDPLALFNYESDNVSGDEVSEGVPLGPLEYHELTGLSSPMQGTIVTIDVMEGDEVRAEQQVAVVEAMKMEHVISASLNGVVRRITMNVGDIVREGDPIIFLEAAELSPENEKAPESINLEYIRSDLQETIDRHAFTLDENRPEAVEKRRERGGRMPRENIFELVDEGSFKEYWPLVVARQHQRHDMETLRKRTPGDGLVAGTCTINGSLFDEESARAAVVHYDYTVLAGTQGHRHHYKLDRMFDLASRFQLPLVVFTEGGGGRPGDDMVGPWVAFDTYTFTQFSKLSAAVPIVGVNHGRCFAGNTALLACCDVIIATKNSTIGMGGPAMIEGGGLGVYTPEEVGPMSSQVPNGVVDILVEDEAEAVQIAKKYISYFQGSLKHWEAHDQLVLRHIVPENRLRLYDMRELIQTIADIDSVLEIREKFGIAMITAFIRIEGKPLGIIANNPHHLSGAIDSDAADKGARFIQLCDAFDIPVLSLMDCPGIMVGPEAEAAALVRHCARMFNTGANLTIPIFGVVVRKAYGLGVQAMCGGSSMVGFFTVAWPTAEFAAMNIEGAVKLGYRNELKAIDDPDKRLNEFNKRVNQEYENSKAINAAVGGGLDDVIDPAETRSWISAGLKRLPPITPRRNKKYPYIDTW